MEYDEARDVMLGLIKATADSESVVLTYTDVPADVPAGSEQIRGRPKVMHADGGQGSLTGGLGTVMYDRSGILWLQLFAPKGDGHTAGYTKGQAFVNALQAYSGSIWFRNVRLTEGTPEGAFERFDVKADFEYTDVR